MKNRLLILLSFLLFSTGIFAQTYSASTEPESIESLQDAGAIAKQIVKASRQKANFAIMEAEVPNALAILKSGKRYVMYNPDFIDQLTRATGTKWAAVSVLAHEIGHHLAPNSERKARVGLATELEADEFSGYVLQKMGATVEEAKAAMKLLATSHATRTHPAGADRLNSITLGWKKAGGIETSTETAYQNKNTVAQSTRTSTTTTSSSGIAATIYLNANPDAVYLVSRKLNVYEAKGNKVQQVGWLTRSQSRSYPYVILDESGTKLYINRYGTIIDEEGNTVGKMKAYS